MAYELTQKCIDLPALDMSAKEKLVLISLARFADDSGKCFPSLPTLEHVTGMDIRTLRKSVAALDAGGWIEFEQEAGKRRFYTLKIERIEASLNADPSQKCTPCKNVPTTNLHPLQECTPTPCKNERGTPYKNAPRIKHIREQEKTNLQTVDDSPFSLEPDQPQTAGRTTAAKTDRTALKELSDKETAPAAKTGPKRKAITHLFELEAIPDEWRELCEQIRPDLDPQRVFVEFRFYWTQGKGMGTRRSDKGWTSTWMNWIKRQKEQRVAQTNGKAPLPPHRDPAFHFGKEYYDKSVNPDGTTNWGV